MAKHEIRAPVGGSVWTHSVGVGQRVRTGTTLLIVECMKTEFIVETTVDGVVAWLRSCGDDIEKGDVVVILDVA
jgi:acetyl-CoA carboxylase biotin carboxyl carrier protein